MTVRLRKTLVVAASAALIAAGLPAGAAHANEPPQVLDAHSDFEGNRGTLLVTVSAPLGVASIHAQLAAFNTGEEVASTGDFVLRSGTATAGVWASTQPFLLDELGSYRVHVTVTDTGGNQVQRADAGVLSYVVVSAFEDVTLDRTTVTYEERDITMTGTVVGRWPGTGEVRPLPGRPVVVNSFADFETVTTDAAGSFTGTVTTSEEGEFVWADHLHDNRAPFVNRATSDFFPITIEPRPTRLTIHANPHQVDRDETTTLTGRLTWLTPDGWEPIPNVQTGILFCRDEVACDQVTLPFTDGHGRYEAVAEPFQTGHFQITYIPVDDFGRRNPFVARADATADIVVLQPAQFSDFRAVRDDRGLVVADGQLQFGNFTPFPIPVDIQFSRSGVGGWETVTTVDADGAGERFTAEIDQPQPGYWRARYPGRRDFFQSAESETVFVP